MAHLKNNEVAVDFERNRKVGTGRAKTSPNSIYLRVGGSSDVYTVTLNWGTLPKDRGHFCALEHNGQRCNGNMNGKARTYGHVSERDRHDPAQYCKHVKAAMAATEKIAEAQDIRAAAFGRTEFAEPVKAEPVKAEPAPVVVTPAEPVKSAADRLAELDRERAELADEISAAERVECFAAVAELEKRFGYGLVREALKAA